MRNSKTVNTLFDICHDKLLSIYSVAEVKLIKLTALKLQREHFWNFIAVLENFYFSESYEQKRSLYCLYPNTEHRKTINEVVSLL
jgi:hypothetical protein